MRLYYRYFLVQIQSVLAYKLSFLLTTIGQFLVSFNLFLGVYFMLLRFPTIKGYNFKECLLCFSLFLLSYSLAEMFFRGFDSFAQIIGNGEFDRILVRPKSPILQVLGSKIEFTRIGRMVQSVGMFSYAVWQINIEWSMTKIVTLILMIAGGTVLFASLFILYAAFCFFTLEGLEFMNIFTDGAREFGRYPIEVYGKKIVKITTYLIPYALVQYYPFLYLIDRSSNSSTLFLPVLAMLFFLPCYGVWKLGLRHYQSTGS